jgi:1-hydroxycarotenoid 3,4-desaturase
MSGQGTTALVIGAGIGGLSAAIDLAAAGIDVEVLEQCPLPGGKLRTASVDGEPIDVGPTVVTMPWVFERLYENAGRCFAESVKLTQLDRLAHHRWQDGSTLDLYPDLAQSMDAIGQFSDVRNANGFGRFMARAKRTYETLQDSFLTSSKPNPLSLTLRAGLLNIQAIYPYSRLMPVLKKYFDDPRLQQLFGRYATYCGASPYLAPASLMLIAHIEQQGVFQVEGGVYALARSLSELATSLGVRIHYNTRVQQICSQHDHAFSVITSDQREFRSANLISNVDVNALAQGLFGPDLQRRVPPTAPRQRSLSAMTWSSVAQLQGPPLAHHNVFFSRNYLQEFRSLASQQMPDDPTVYLCASGCGATAAESAPVRTRLFCLINAPANGDHKNYTIEEADKCRIIAERVLDRCGLQLRQSPSRVQTTTPSDFAALYPGTGGGLYGRANHGWMATFLRPGNRTRLPGLYLTGGSVHPGPGLPMAALSGRLAATALLKDWTSLPQSRPEAIAGGTWMR